jgi:murein DD-endopeptidase MepM/ murein hydrolase activator NlpD
VLVNRILPRLKRIINKSTFLILHLLVISISAQANPLSNDTLNALVINTDTKISTKLKDLSGTEVISLIDSLLDLKELPEGIIKELTAIVGEIAWEEESPVLLSGFYDDTPYPSNSYYENWDNYKIHPMVDAEDTRLTLVLQDESNNCSFHPPLIGLITSNYGWREGKSHHGVDIDLHVWDPVYAAFDGMVRVARNHPSYGRVVIVRHYNGLETLYAHLHRFKVKAGDVVEAGQIVGLGGSSGRSTGSHLHFETRFKGRSLNPRSFIDFNNNRLMSDSIVLTKNRWDGYSCYPAGLNFYTVKQGDFLVKIASQYGTSVDRICELNGIRRNAILRVGKKLRIE